MGWAAPARHSVNFGPCLPRAADQARDPLRKTGDSQELLEFLEFLDSQEFPEFPDFRDSQEFLEFPEFDKIPNVGSGLKIGFGQEA